MFSLICLFVEWHVSVEWSNQVCWELGEKTRVRSNQSTEDQLSPDSFLNTIRAFGESIGRSAPRHGRSFCTSSDCTMFSMKWSCGLEISISLSVDEETLKEQSRFRPARQHRYNARRVTPRTCKVSSSFGGWVSVEASLWPRWSITINYCIISGFVGPIRTDQDAHWQWWGLRSWSVEYFPRLNCEQMWALGFKKFF